MTVLTFYYPGSYPLSNRKADKWTTPIYLAGVLEYLTAEVLELAGDVAKGGKKARIAPRHIMLAVRNDEEVRSPGLHFSLSCYIVIFRSTSSCLGSPSLLVEWCPASILSSCPRSLSRTKTLPSSFK